MKPILVLFSLLPLTRAISFTSSAGLFLDNYDLNGQSIFEIYYFFDQAVNLGSATHLRIKPATEMTFDYSNSASLSVCKVDDVDVTCILDNINKTIYIPISTGKSSYKVNVGVFTNPGYSTQTGNNTLYLMNGSTTNTIVAQRDGFKITFSTGTLTTNSFSFESTKVAAITTYHFRFTPQNNIPSNSSVVFTFPNEIALNAGDTAVKVDGTVDGTAFAQKSEANGGITIVNQTMTIIGLFQVDFTDASNKYLEFSISGVRNPTSLEESGDIDVFTQISTFKIDRTKTSAPIKLRVQPTEPCELLNPTLQNDPSASKVVSLSTSLDFTFTVLANQDIGQMEVVFPPTINITSASHLPSGIGGNLQSCTKTGQSYICNVASYPVQYTLLKFNNIVNPADTTTTDYFQIYLRNSSNTLICKHEQFATYQARANNIAITTPITRPKVVGVVHNFQTTFTVNNSASSPYTIRVYIPLDQIVPYNTLGCSWGHSPASLTGLCTISQLATELSLTFTNGCGTPCADPTSFTFEVTGVRNPAFVDVYTSTVRIYFANLSIFDADNTQGIIAKVDTGVVYETLEPKPFSAVIVRSNNIVAGDIGLQFEITIGLDYPQHSYVKTLFPEGSTFQDSEGSAIACNNILQDGTVEVKTCNIQSLHAADSSIKEIRVIDPCPNVNSCPASTDYTVQLLGLENRFSVYDFAAGYYLNVLTQDGKEIQLGSVDSTGLQLIPGTPADFSVLRSTNIVSTKVSFNIKFSTTGRIPRQNTDQSNSVILTFPENLVKPVSSAVTCARGSDDTSLDCSTQTITNGSVTSLTIQNYCSTATCVKGSQIFIKILGAINPPAIIAGFSGNVTLQTTETSKIPKDTGSLTTQTIDTATIVYNTLLEPMPLINPLVHPINPSVSINTDYIIVFTVSTGIPTNAYLNIVFPNNFNIPAGSLICSPYINNDSTLSCNYNASTRTVRIEKFENSTNSKGLEIGLKIMNVLNYSTAGTSNPFQLTIYDSTNQLMFSDSTQTVTLGASIPDDQCHPDCEHCAVSTDNCYSCPIPSVKPLQQDYTCQEQCPDGQFMLQPDRICLPCYYTCATCYDYNTNKCETCIEGFVFNNGECIEECPATTTDRNGLCESASCTAPCDRCTEDTSFCLSCISGYILFPETPECIQNTPNDDCHMDLYYELNSFCVSCDFPCYDCTTTASKCTECYTYYSQSILNKADSTCVSQCPANVTIQKTEGSSQVCEPCHISCATCDEITEFDCLTCPADRTTKFEYVDAPNLRCVANCDTASGGTVPYHYENTDGRFQCLVSCPAMHYTKDVSGLIYCLPCSTTCKTCNATNGRCTSCDSAGATPYLSTDGLCLSTCSDPYYFYENGVNLQCVLICPGTDLKWTNPANGRNQCTTDEACEALTSYYVDAAGDSCTQCYSRCLECDGPNNDDCTSCRYTGSYPYNSSGECVAQCTSDKFHKDTGTEKRCVTSCETEYHYTNTSLLMKFCYSSCPNKTYEYQDGALNYCGDCYNNCAECTNATSQGCTECIDEFPFLNDNGSCTQTCSGSDYSLETGGRKYCVGTCPSTHLHFINSSGQRTCITSCSTGNYISGTNCLPCDSSCKTCNGGNSNNCLSCDIQSAYSNLTPDGTCESECGDLFVYLENNQFFCLEACPSNTYSLVTISAKECVQQCPMYYYPEGLNCASCNNTCSFCSGPSDNQCTDCKDTYAFYQGQCVLACPEGYTKNSGICTTTCGSGGCDNCGSDGICIECTAGYILYNGNCYTQCPAGSYRIAQTCEPCNADCKTCIGPSSNECSSCNNQQFLYNFSCFSSCPSGTTPSEGQCLEGCQPPCSNCSPGSSVACISCLEAYPYLYSSYCYETCPDGRYGSDNMCLPCDPTCKSCSDAQGTSCLSCDTKRVPPLFLTGEGTCTEACPDGYYGDSDSGKCEEEDEEDRLEANGYPVYALIAETFILLLLILISFCRRKESTDVLPNLLALLGIVEVSERIMLMGFLWFERIEHTPILFGLCGGFLMGSVVLSMIFTQLYVDPLVESSATLDKFVETYKCSFYTIYYLSFVFGVNFVRLLYGGLFEAPALTLAKALGAVPAFRLPLEKICFYKVLLVNLPYLVQQVAVLALYEIDRNSFHIAAFGLGFNIIYNILFLLDYQRGIWRSVS